MAGTTAVDNTTSWKDWKEQHDRAKAASGTTLSMNDFYKLLASQLSNQDMNSPLDNSEMMNQMVQMAMMQAINDMTTVNTTTYAASMVGKEATFATVNASGVADGSVSGVITSVDLYNYVFYLNGDMEKPYPMAYLMTLHSEGSSNIKPPEPGDGDGADPEVPGTNPETPGTDPETPGTNPEAPGEKGKG